MTIHQVFWGRFLLLTSWLVLGTSGAALGQGATAGESVRKDILPPPWIKQYEEPKAARFLVVASEFIRVGEARTEFRVNGDGMAVAVIDTGLRVTHEDFKGRVPAQINLTSENAGNADDAKDLDGHGTH